MKTKTTFLLATLGLALLQPASAQLTIPSDGSDGALAPSGDLVIDLSQAVTGVWTNDNTANAGKGIYDPSKWAVVFKYSSVNIPSNGTVTFKNHASRAPVVWLVQGNVNVDGIVDLPGQGQTTGSAALLPGEPGPGGFRGGAIGPQGDGAGLGPGGGLSGNGIGDYAGSYGNPQLLPLIGGSGGHGNRYHGKSGGAGSGAILVAASGTVGINGLLTAMGTIGTVNNSGSAGAVRIIAGQVLGSGEINCLKAVGASSGDGRIRIESPSLASSLRTFPETIAVPPANPPILWPPDNAPKVRLVSVDAVLSPADPTAPLVSTADIAIQKDTPVVIELETRDFPIEGNVSVRLAQKWGNATWQNAAYVSGNQAQASWRLTNTLVKGYTTLQARATAP